MSDDNEDIFFDENVKITRRRSRNPKTLNIWTCNPIIKLHDDKLPTFGVKLKKTTLEKTRRNKKTSGRRLKKVMKKVFDNPNKNVNYDELRNPMIVTIINFSCRRDLDNQMRNLFG